MYEMEIDVEMISGVPKFLYNKRGQHLTLILAPFQEPGEESEGEWFNSNADLL